ncbi:Ig-like domain-containing protein [Calidifontimicrobium sp. SYSU G02091]|uniref:Ig-like domain-containing protein n=1 Tax=Calidifontimicrobium sp. SYSU G02091 TaxID=2926421 RepID=UPI001F53631B|nr:Ig-like domain-containing protein [Calidifontimicrobium sp. SYSU G02091]MCI1193337.1 Ig-like domain-containing protein [Calidifontimicrobium sp. SYSU G02091]
MKDTVMKPGLKTVLAAAFAVVLAACGGGSSPPSANVTAAGGTVVSDDGKVRLVVPAGAVSAPAFIRIERTEAESSIAADPHYVPGSSYRVSGDLGELALPATWEWSLDDALPASGSMSRPLSATAPTGGNLACNGRDGRPIGPELVLGAACPSGCLRMDGAIPFVQGTYSMCVPTVPYYYIDRLEPFCSNNPPHPGGLVAELVEVGVDVEVSNIGDYDIGPQYYALCRYKAPPPPPVLVNNLPDAPLATPCVASAGKLSCQLAKVGPGVLSVVNDTTPPSSIFFTILDQPGGSQTDPRVLLDANGNGTMRYHVTGADDRFADFAELYELRIAPGSSPSGQIPVVLEHVRLATLTTDVVPDPKLFASSTNSLGTPGSIPFNASDPLYRYFFARLYDRAGNYRDSPIKRVRRETPVAEIASFTASPATLPPPSGTTTLSWTVANATSLTIDQGVGNVTAQTVNGTGSIQVAVESTRTFTLSITGPNGSTAQQSVTVTVAPDTTAPSVTLAASPGTVMAPGSTTLTATATDNVGVTQVQFFRGSTLLATDDTPGNGFTHTLALTAADQGTVSFTARAFDAAGNQATSGAINVLVTVPTSADRYAAPAGSDTNPGTQAQPYRTLTKAFAEVGSGGTVWLADGAYTWAAEQAAGAPAGANKTRAFPAGRTLRAINPGSATLNFGLTVAGDATIVGVHLTNVDGDGTGSGGTGVTVVGGAAANSVVQLKGVSFGALDGGSGDGWGAALMNYCATCAVTLDTNGLTGFNYVGADFKPGRRLITNLGGPLTVDGGTLAGPNLSVQNSGCGSSVFTGHRANFNGVTITLPATAASPLGEQAFCVLGDEPVTFTNSTITQQGSGRNVLFIVGFSYSGIPGTGRITLNNSVVSAPPSGVLFALRLPGVHLTANGATLTGGTRTITRGGMDSSNSVITLTNTTVQNVNGDAVDIDSLFGGSTVRITGGEMKNIQGSALRFVSGNVDVKVRNVAITSAGLSQGSGAVVLVGDATSLYDLGTAAEPGGNTILGHSTARPGVRVNLAGGGIARAVGNTWIANQQGASSTGTYSGNVLVTSGSGQNYVIDGGSLRLAGN